MFPKSIFEPEIEEFLKLKSESTQTVYKASFNEFLKFYRQQHGEEANIGHFLDNIFENMKKPPRERKRLAESEIVDFIMVGLNFTPNPNWIQIIYVTLQFIRYKLSQSNEGVDIH